jgi:hypothetical protein
MDEDSNPIEGDTATNDSESMNGEYPNGSQTAEVKWTSKVGDQLKRHEQCLFKTVG